MIEKPDKADTIIICYGNDLMGNDAFGKGVFDALPSDTNKLFSHQLLPELLEEVQKYNQLIFVDASIGSGEVECYQTQASDELTGNFHHLTPQVFLTLLSVMYTKAPEAHICTAYFEDFKLAQKDDDFDLKVDLAVRMIGQLLSK